MKLQGGLLLLFAVFLASALAGGIPAGEHGEILEPLPGSSVTFPTPLQKWVWADQGPDGKYGWKVYGSRRNPGSLSTTYFINVTMFHWLRLVLSSMIDFHSSGPEP